MNHISRAAAVISSVLVTACWASADYSLGWRELRFVTQDDWSVYAAEAPITSEEAANRLAKLTIKHHGRAVSIPFAAYGAIDDPIISGIKVVNVFGTNAIRIEIPLLQTPELREVCKRRIWVLSIVRDAYVNAKSRDEPDRDLAELCD